MPSSLKDFDILDKLGQGSFGVVYRARRKGKFGCLAKWIVDCEAKKGCFPTLFNLLLQLTEVYMC